MHQLNLEEQKTIIAVINRDAELRSKEKERIQTLNGLLIERAYQVKGSEEERKSICDVCGRKLGLIFCRGVQCSFCGSYVCGNQVCGFETDCNSWSSGTKFACPGFEVVLRQLHKQKRQKEIQDIAKKSDKPMSPSISRPEQLYQHPVSNYVLHSQPTQFLFHFN